MRLKTLFIERSCHELIKLSEFFIDHLKAIGEVSTEHDKNWKLGEVADFRLMIQSFDMIVVWRLSGVITLTHNLAQRLHDDSGKTKGLIDDPEAQKRAERLNALKEKLYQTIRTQTSLRETLTNANQRSVKFYRWLRFHHHDPSPWPESHSSPTRSYHRF